MKIAPRERVILTIVGAVIVVAVLAVALLLPKFNQLGDLDTQLAQANQKVTIAQTLLTQRRGYKQRSADTNAEALRLASQVPETEDLPSVIIDLQNAAFDSGVQLVGVTPSTPTSTAAGTGSYETVAVQVQILGTWADTVDYIQRIQDLTRGVRVKQVTAAVSSNSAQSNTENQTLPDYFEATTINLEVYLIPSTTATSTGN